MTPIGVIGGPSCFVSAEPALMAAEVTMSPPDCVAVAANSVNHDQKTHHSWVFFSTSLILESRKPPRPRWASAVTDFGSSGTQSSSSLCCGIPASKARTSDSR